MTSPWRDCPDSVDTGGVLNHLSDRAPDRIAWLALAANRGKAEAVRAGLLAALDRQRTRYVGYWDADLAAPLGEIDVLREVLEHRDEIDFVLGIRLRLPGSRIQRGKVRELLGRTFAAVVSLWLRHRFRDTQCGAKLFRATPRFREAVQ